MLVEILVVDKHCRIHDAAPLHADGHVAVTEVIVHHVSQSPIFLTMSVHHDAEQFAAPFVCVVMEHLQGDEVIGRGADIRIEYHERNALVFCWSWLYGVVVSVARTR